MGKCECDTSHRYRITSEVWGNEARLRCDECGDKAGSVPVSSLRDVPYYEDESVVIVLEPHDRPEILSDDEETEE